MARNFELPDQLGSEREVIMPEGANYSIYLIPHENLTQFVVCFARLVKVNETAMPLLEASHPDVANRFNGAMRRFADGFKLVL